MNKLTKGKILEITKAVDVPLINKILKNTDLREFEIDQQTIFNISEWALDGKSDSEIRTKLSLNKKQWNLLVEMCPSLVMVMSSSRQLAEVMIAGSLFQRAVGGIRIKKQMPVKMKDYNEDGKVIGEHLEIAEYEEELPPESSLLKYLAEKKLSEKLGDGGKKQQEDFKNIVENMTDEERRLIEAFNEQK